ncbi:TPA: replication initiator protein A [Pseudomonas aeruginosa]|nr:replication initiator protein A [Pseudomonas aeruginosa]
MTSRHSGPQPIGAVLGELGGALDRLGENIRRRNRERIEAAALPGETYEHAAARLQREADQERRPAAHSSQPATLVRKPPKGDEQSDFFAPTLYDVGTRDSRSVMDVAVFRLSKKDKRAGELVRYDLPDGYVEVSAGAHGMASVWDYDIVLMLVSHLTEAMNRYREGKGDKPGRVFRPHVSDILKFARRGDGSRQVEEVEAALDRLRGTTIKTVRENGKFRTTEAEGLIARYRVLSRTDTKRISSVEIEAPEWIYREVVDGKRPEVLTVHPDYFLIEPGIGRYLYRLARRAAGRTEAKWSFATIYERSGSTGTLKKFTENLRKIITANDLPEYTLTEEPGQSGPQLIMRHRNVQADSPGP